MLRMLVRELPVRPTGGIVRTTCTDVARVWIHHVERCFTLMARFAREPIEPTDTKSISDLLNGHRK